MPNRLLNRGLVQVARSISYLFPSCRETKENQDNIWHKISQPDMRDSAIFMSFEFAKVF